ncbi:Bro-N domain-containing protein [Stenotrophomonas sp.]|uniref:BRO-N domain-containing protein n=1 Tax=Stenotrophomonas sp. TaxID=69392 RepID=UPI0028AE4DA2|nr:Bro-N domain-containing protein [Stenotrophomonas sp.]
MSSLTNNPSALAAMPPLPNSAKNHPSTPVLPFRFESISVRAVEIDGAPWFVGKDIAEALGYANVADALAKYCKGVAKRYPLQTAGGVQDLRIISEPDLFRLVANSRLADAERFERWIFEEVLPSIRKTGGYQQPQPLGLVGDGCALIESAARALRLAPSVTLGMYQRLGSKVGHQDLLPQYAVDASNGADATSSDVTFPLTRLLEDFQVGMSAQRVNKMLEAAGILEHVSRSSTRTGTKKFWSITAAGGRFGKNVTSPESPRQTQPHYYQHRFAELLDLVGLGAAQAA